MLVSVFSKTSKKPHTYDSKIILNRSPIYFMQNLKELPPLTTDCCNFCPVNKNFRVFLMFAVPTPL